MADWKQQEEAWTESLLEQMAELFDEGVSVSPDTLLEVDGYAISAGALLRRIRLHEALGRIVDTNEAALRKARGL